MTDDWNTRQPVTLLSTPPVLANPAMKWRRQGQPQKMETKTMMKVVILAMCSSSAPGPAPSLLDRETIWPLYSIKSMLQNLLLDPSSIVIKHRTSTPVSHFARLKQ